MAISKFPDTINHVTFLPTFPLFGPQKEESAVMKASPPFRVALAMAVAILALAAIEPAVAQDKPNILVFWGDDVGMWNISAYHRGMMGGATPNIDRLAAEGALFTDHYAQQSCTAGRAAFITGQHSFRTGLLSIGMPGADQVLERLKSAQNRGGG